MHVRTSLSLLLPFLVLATACSDPVLGKWRSDKKLPNGARNTLEVEDDLGGEAKLYATPEYDHNLWIEFKFKIDGEEADNGFRWDFKMKCKSGPCNENGRSDNFEMKCRVFDGDENGGLDKLNCKGDDLWVSYPFDWERDED